MLSICSYSTTFAGLYHKFKSSPPSGPSQPSKALSVIPTADMPATYIPTPICDRATIYNCLILSTISDLELHCHSFFRYNTVPRLATYFEKCIWLVELQNAALTVHHPTIFRAAIALGAVHRRFCYGISREAFDYCAHAARLYHRAVNPWAGSSNHRTTQPLVLTTAS